MKTVITYGTFDLFHAGHVRILQRTRALGDRLIVGCSTDEFNSIKGKKAIFSFEDRVAILESCKYVDLVIPENGWGQKANDVRQYSADIFAMGDDWAGKFDSLGEETGCIVTYLPRTPNISSTDVKSIIKSIEFEKRHQILNTIENLRKQIEAL